MSKQIHAVVCAIVSGTYMYGSFGGTCRWPNLNYLPKYGGRYLTSSCVTNDRVESNAQASCLK